MKIKAASTVTVESIQGSGYAQKVNAGEHVLNADEPIDRGGTDTGPTPTDLMVASLGSCTAITLQMYARRKEWDLGRVHVELSLYSDGDTQRIERTIHCSGAANLTEEQRSRLLDISNKTPVTKTLLSGISIRTQLEHR